MDLEKIILKWVLYNSLKYNSPARLQSVVSKILIENPKLKENIKDLIPKIQEIINKTKDWDVETKKNKLKNIDPSLFKELFENPKDSNKEKEQPKNELPPLKGAIEGKFASRAAPNPNGYLHLGHTRHILLAYLYAKKYKGKFILRYEDTDPKIKRPLPEAYDAIYDDICWLIEDKPDEVYIQSERLEIYYNYAKKLIEKGLAYVDLSSAEEIRKCREKGIPTKYRNNTIEKNLELWDKMLNWEFEEGQAVLRIKTDIKHPNPSVRDWIAFRIINTEKYSHPRVGSKYCVWPTYNFACPIDDHLMQLTHIFRMKEHEVNAQKQEYIYKYFNWEPPIVYNYGALIIKDLPSHKSEIRKLIEEKKIEGWDDPFIPTIKGIRRRGILPKAIKKYIKEININPSDITFSWDKLFKYNRELLDPIVDRYFAIKEPINVIIENLPEILEIKIRKHPKNPSRGYRTLYLKEKVIIEKKDIDPKTKYIRLMEACNLEISKVDLKNNIAYAKYIDNNLETARKLKAKIIHWLSDYKKYKIYEPTGKHTIYVEPECLKVPSDTIIQFERYCFAKHEKENKMFIYTHK